MMAIKGRILQLQNYSVNDGDGIRTTIFFAGCPLRCRWCSNPEGYTQRNKIMYISSRCIACGRCAEVCPEGINFDFTSPKARERCTGCGACADACLEKARKNAVTEYTVADIAAKLKPQLRFFYKSGGGVTYSGGECTQQIEFLSSLADAVYDMGLQQAMESSACFDLQEVKPVLDKMDLLFFDIKLMNREKHVQFTGAANDVILSNIAAVGAERRGIVVRIPVIMGVNGDDANVRETARFVKVHLQEPQIELLPYHSYGADKYAQLGMPYDDAQFRTPSEDEMKHLKEIVQREGVRIVSFA